MGGGGGGGWSRFGGDHTVYGSHDAWNGGRGGSVAINRA